MQPSAFDGGPETGCEVGGIRHEVDRLEAGLHAAGLDAGKIQQRVHQLEQADTTAVRKLDESSMLGQRSGIR
jgi:hypothetical protein